MRNKKAFTLIELLVVIAIISLLVSILLPSLTKAKELARFTVCKTQFRSLGIATTLFQGDNDGKFPYRSGQGFSGHYKNAMAPYLDLTLTNSGYITGDHKIFECPSGTADELEYWNSLYRIANWNLNLPNDKYGLVGVKKEIKVADARKLGDLNNKPLNEVLWFAEGRKANDALFWWKGTLPEIWGQISERHDEHVNVLWADTSVSDMERLDFTNSTFKW